ncbi:MAG: UdgX family uracil-DNA binding protein [Planctomycetota bacterium]
MQHHRVSFFEDWRELARSLVNSGVSPANVHFIDGRSDARSGQLDLFADEIGDNAIEPAKLSANTDSNATSALKVPAAFLGIARTVTHHRRPSRFGLLYRMLWRICNGERHLMNVASDSDVLQAIEMEKAVRRDAHKMKAFVRFRKVEDELGEHFIAWHRPDHYSLRYTSDFFARRFDCMRWTIMTPEESVTWDGEGLEFGPGMPRSEAPAGDKLESLWKTYYANIFNPARIKLKAMQAEMPKKHWATMPETELIDQMLREAPRRVERMIAQTDAIVTAKAFVPKTDSLDELREAAVACQGCELCHSATQTVFGTGPKNASVMLIGEQPGDQEDLAGVPFVGPAGQLLDEVLSEIGFDREKLYVTNAVKHFKHTRSGKRRLHKKPSSRDVAACRHWLDAEIELIRPKQIVCLGATAAGVVFGPNFKLTENRGVVFETDAASWTMATYHPSALLRAQGNRAQGNADALRAAFESDLRMAFEASGGLSTKTVVKSTLDGPSAITNHPSL